MKKNYNPTIKDVYEDLQRIKKVLSILLDKEGIRKSDLDNQERLRREGDAKAERMRQHSLNLGK